MVEGDLIDLTLPSLLQAMTREKAIRSPVGDHAGQYSSSGAVETA